MMKKLTLSHADIADLWKQRFFEAQAGMEKFLVETYGYDAIDGWINHNAEIFKSIEVGSGSGAESLAIRFAKQAECYQSDYHIDHVGQDAARVTIFHCGIWDYREKARQRGVSLTFDSPCTRYCTKLTSALIESNGYEASYQLMNIGPHHGCHWSISKECP